MTREPAQLNVAASGHAVDPVKPACSGPSGLRRLALLAVMAVIGGLLVLCCCSEDASEAHSADAQSATPPLSDLGHAVAASDPLAEHLSDVVEDGSRTLFVDTDALGSRRDDGSFTATVETGTGVYDGLVATAAPHPDCDPHSDGLGAIVLSAAPALDGMPGLIVLPANIDAPSGGAGSGRNAVLRQATPESSPYLLCILRT
ncbi:hypothetical protein ACQPZQ_45025 [Pseudonocardia sp. CA-142604]|uniref:hypothetical protein n=1 Tax=Pseudonocardia sp. CA-142604 TaxID=3240024 RepID=UPI003D89C084